MNWILSNLSTIIISLLLIAAVTGIVFTIRRDKKKENLYAEPIAAVAP